jgi:ribokinase
VSQVALYSIGNLTIDDIVCWPTGQTWIGQAGGNVLFSALGARIWLDRVGLLTRVGKDYPPERLQEIEARGLTVGFQEVDAPTLHDWALYEEGGARQFVNHLSSGTNEALTLEPDEISSEHLNARAYHLAPVPAPQQARLVSKLKRPGTCVSLDPHESWIRGYEGLIRSMVEDVDFFLPSEVEARILYGSNAPQQAAREFASLGPRAVVIKIGPDGSILYDRARDRLTLVPAYPAHAIDPTGAGDAYCGGFMAGYTLTADVLAAACYGTVSASYVVEAIGALATAQPSRPEALERLARVQEGMHGL